MPKTARMMTAAIHSPSTFSVALGLVLVVNEGSSLHAGPARREGVEGRGGLVLGERVDERLDAAQRAAEAELHVQVGAAGVGGFDVAGPPGEHDEVTGL